MREGGAVLVEKDSATLKSRVGIEVLSLTNLRSATSVPTNCAIGLVYSRKPLPRAGFEEFIGCKAE
jgi:hypothetical protein